MELLGILFSTAPSGFIHFVAYVKFSSYTSLLSLVLICPLSPLPASLPLQAVSLPSPRQPVPLSAFLLYVSITHFPSNSLGFHLPLLWSSLITQHTHTNAHVYNLKPRFHIWENVQYLTDSGLFHLMQWSSVPSIFLQMSLFFFFLWPHKVPHVLCALFSLCTHVLVLCPSYWEYSSHEHVCTHTSVVGNTSSLADIGLSFVFPTKAHRGINQIKAGGLEYSSRGWLLSSLGYPEAFLGIKVLFGA